MNAPLAARAAAIAIAVAAIIDPAIPMTRPSKPLVSVVTATRSDSVLAGRVRSRLDGEFVVLDAPFGGADATVIVGDRLMVAPAEPVFAVLPGRDLPSIRIESLHAPERAALEAVVPVRVRGRVAGAAGRTITLSLMAGALELDRIEHIAGSDDERFDARLAFVPADTGAARVRVVAHLAGRSSAADRIVDVGARRLSLLFHDARPSWQSTFVRRAVERDPRFVVTSRTITSDAISIDAGRPGSLADARALAPYDAVVIGAPESLPDREVAALDSYMRTRGGAVVLLLDRAGSGPWRRLAGVDGWIEESADSGVSIARTFERDEPGGPPELRATRLFAPASLPAWASAMAVSASDARPVIWRSAVGPGRVIASGVLDAWRFRDPTDSRFDSFWPGLIAEAGSATPPAVDVHVEDPVVSPGEATAVTVMLPELALLDPVAGDTVSAPVTATLAGAGGRRGIRLWPDGPVGVLRGEFSAPNEPGAYRVRVAYGDAEGNAALVVAAGPLTASPDERDLVAAWVRAHGGDALAEDRLADLPAALLAVLEPPPRRDIVRPMRSAWWIVPFVLALGAEWWWRRRHGLA